MHDGVGERLPGSRWAAIRADSRHRIPVLCLGSYVLAREPPSPIGRAVECPSAPVCIHVYAFTLHTYGRTDKKLQEGRGRAADRHHGTKMHPAAPGRAWQAMPDFSGISMPLKSAS